VVIGYGRVGGAGAQGLQSAGVPLSVVEEDLHLVQHLRTAGVPAIYGDAAYASVLQASHPERALLVVVTLPDAGSARTVVREVRQLNPGVPILVRARTMNNRPGEPAPTSWSHPSKPGLTRWLSMRLRRSLCPGVRKR
jgi:monovalent cation:H+ antiporter-2, CPA2 family